MILIFSQGSFDWNSLTDQQKVSFCIFKKFWKVCSLLLLLMQVIDIRKEVFYKFYRTFSSTLLEQFLSTEI